MKLGRPGTAALAACGTLAGCATNPPVEVRYYQPRLDMLVTDARTVACDKHDAVHVADTVTTQVVYSSDRAHPRYIRFHDLDGSLTNSDLGVTLTDDGRLSGLNATEEGQGGEVVEAVLAVAAAVAAAASDGSSATHNACDYISKNGKDNVLTVTFAAKEPFAAYHGAQQMQPIADDATLFSNLRVLTGDLCLITEAPDPGTVPPIRYEKGTRDDVEIPMLEPAPVKVSVVVAGVAACPIDRKPQEIWSSTVQVPQRGVPYTLPLPSARAFGTRSVTLALNNSGAITKLEYGSKSGAASALTAIGKAVPLLQEGSDADKAAKLKAKADIIAQQERLVRCQASPTTCAS